MKIFAIIIVIFCKNEEKIYMNSMQEYLRSNTRANLLIMKNKTNNLVSRVLHYVIYFMTYV